MTIEAVAVGMMAGVGSWMLSSKVGDTSVAEVPVQKSVAVAEAAASADFGCCYSNGAVLPLAIA